MNEFQELSKARRIIWSIQSNLKNIDKSDLTHLEKEILEKVRWFPTEDELDIEELAS